MRHVITLAFFSLVLGAAAPYAWAEDVTVTSRVSGFVKSVVVKQGDTVKKGDPLAYLDDEMARIAERKAKAEVKAAEAREMETKRHLERQEVMAKRGLIPPSELEDAQTAAAFAEGRAELARARLDEAKLNLEYTVIKAPTSGRMKKVFTYEGQVIRLDVEVTALFEIITP